MAGFSQRRFEGYVLVDHSDSPGLSDAEMAFMGDDLPPGAGRIKFEAPNFICPHCTKGVIMNPDRKRERAVCHGCEGRYLCDQCGAVAKVSNRHYPFAQVVDEVLEAVVKRQPLPIFNPYLGGLA